MPVLPEIFACNAAQGFDQRLVFLFARRAKRYHHPFLHHIIRNCVSNLPSDVPGEKPGVLRSIASFLF